jgi:phosphotransferase system IIB component
MKNINKILSVLTVLVLLFSTSCTKDFDEINNDPTQITPEQLTADFQHVGSKYKPIFESIYIYSPAWKYQLQQNLNADVYSGYLTNPRPFVGGANNTTYNLVPGWNNFIWTIPYQNIMNNIHDIEEKTEGEYPVFYAIAKILKVEAMHRVSDVFGPIVYTHYGESATTSTYDSQEEVYTAFFEDLDTAVNLLENDLSNTTFTKFDMVYGGDLTKWVKFANSLRLRLAVRIAMADPAKAQQEAEKALSNANGLIETNDESFIIHGDKAHPLLTIANAWDDIRMNADMESILSGFNDPRISKYFSFKEEGDNATIPVVPGEYKGIRNGLPLLSNYADELAQKAAYVNFSVINKNIMTPNVQLMTAAEVYFLKAEAALRGWSGAGDAQTNYETGITTSFDQRGASGAAAYIADNTSTPADYVDPVNASNSINAVSSITIAWDNSDSDEVKLEKIITQKWIAMFPDGQEAWSEFRRTGYPKLFPVVSNQSGGTIDTNIQIRRIPFVVSEYDTNSDGVADAITKLGGPDNGGTRLWWDTGSNF